MNLHEDWLRSTPKAEEIDAQIEAGWGHVPQTLIPGNWRELQPPSQAEGPAQRRMRMAPEQKRAQMYEWMRARQR